MADQLGLTPAQLRSVLESLACAVHEQSEPGQDTVVFEGERLLSILYRTGFQIGMQDVPEFLAQHAGILVSPRPYNFYFVHRSFQDHLAACELTCAAPAERRPVVPQDRRFPQGLIDRAVAAP